jgi:hypothetical protein
MIDFPNSGAIDSKPRGHRAWGYSVVWFYHGERNHQGLENKIIRPEFAPFPSAGTLKRRKRLGGLLSPYYREAA